MSEDICELPDPLQFLEFFGVEASEARPEDAYWCYTFADEHGIELRFSVNEIERSVQTVLLSHGETLSTCAHEGAVKVALWAENEGKSIRAHCRYGNAYAELVAQVTPRIKVNWAVLLKAE